MAEETQWAESTVLLRTRRLHLSDVGERRGIPMDTSEKTTFPTTEPSSSTPYWAEELDPRHTRFRAKIGGLHCSLSTGTLEKALGRLLTVEKRALNLNPEQTHVEHHPTAIRRNHPAGTLPHRP